MLKVGLTGGIGSGKTVVAQLFTVMGIPVFDADREAKKLMSESAEIRSLLLTHFGNEIYTGKTLNRAVLSSIVFSDAYKLELLNSIVHPATIEAAREWMAMQPTAYVVKEAALLFESGSAGDLDFIVGVTAPLALRIKRVMHRDGSRREDVKARMDKQLDDSLKMKLCDFVIINDEQQPLLPQVQQLHEKLLLLSKTSRSSHTK